MYSETAHKNSRKRTAILEALCATKEHPTAEMIYDTLKGDIPDLSLGTVYRNLSMFCEEGKAQSIGKVGGRERFDGRTESHPHFVCRVCSRVLDVDVPADIESLYCDIEHDSGLSPEHYSLTLTGVCADCRS